MVTLKEHAIGQSMFESNEFLESGLGINTVSSKFDNYVYHASRALGSEAGSNEVIVV